MLSFNDVNKARNVFEYFVEISKIPHGSGNTDKIADYLVSFAKKRGLYVYRDAANNVLIKKGATPGYESRPTVILQGHTDMVAEKLPELDMDMKTEGLTLYRDGDLLRAKGTTLGGDDGIAVAYALAILDSSDICHPDIEALFTSDEEIGLIGANAFDTSKLDGKIMLNLDSDAEGIFIAGCAGGARIDFSLPIKRASSDKRAYKITLSGLLGGHSGGEIDKGRGNAIKLLCEALSRLDGILIADLYGGNADNAIPREATAVIYAETLDKEALGDIEEELKLRYRENDPDIAILVEECASEKMPLDADSTVKILSFASEVKTGVIDMSKDIEGLVETSENIGITRLNDSELAFTVSVRSSIAASKASVIAGLRAIAEKYGAEIGIRGEYPGWAYRKDSHLRDTCKKVYKDMYGKEASVIAIHAGLECGIFSDKIEGLDCISFGPNNYDIHTTEERLSISSTERVFEFLLSVLKEI